MYAIYVESSQQRGMGHLFRALNFTAYLREIGEKYIVFINDDAISINILNRQQIPYYVLGNEVEKGNLISDVIRNFSIDVILLDRFSTSFEVCSLLKKQNILLAAIDDCGTGATLLDIHFCSMLFENLKGKHILKGKEFLILNSEIQKYRRIRTKVDKILVTLGGSDTYGVTVKVIRILKKLNYKADIIIGPHFKFHQELMNELDEGFNVFSNVESLIYTFSMYDLAITGGGVTCIEASASGLPCLIVANELHEIDIARYVASFGGAIYLGYHQELNKRDFILHNLDIKQMSEKALQAFELNGAANIYRAIEERRKRWKKKW